MRVWDIKTGKLTANTALEIGGGASVGFTLDGQWIVIGTGAGRIHCVFASNGLIRTPRMEGLNPVTTLALSADTKTVATGDNRGQVMLWDVDQLVGLPAIQMARP